MTNRISIHDTPAIDTLRKELRFEPGLLRRLRVAFYKHARGESAALAELPAPARRVFAERVDFHPLVLDRRIDSQTDGATKLLFRTRAGMLIESVILRAGTGRVALCVSSQVGCAAACDFCATGRMGVAHGLAAGEILDQLVQANQLLREEGRSVRNLVFMGMGEPLHNQAAVGRAIDTLVDPALLHHPPGRVLVSTMGVADRMVAFAERFPSVNLALSLHSVRQETREQIIPLARKFPLPVLRDTLARVQRAQTVGGKRRRVMIEYLMLAGVNDSSAEAEELVAWLHDPELGGLDAHVNLIPYNSVKEAPHLSGSDRPTRERFASVLKSAGLPTTIRYSMGADIQAACGQLVQSENRAVASQLAKRR